MKTGYKILIGSSIALISSYIGFLYYRKNIWTPTMEITRYTAGKDSFDYKVSDLSSGTISLKNTSGGSGISFGKFGMIEWNFKPNKVITFVTKRNNKVIKSQTFDFSKSAPNIIKF